MAEDNVVKLGVVIFEDDNYSDEGLAALQWVTRALPKNSYEVYILHIEKVDEQNGTTNIAAAGAADDIKEPLKFFGDQVSDLFPDAKGTFDVYKEKIGIQYLHGRSYKRGTKTIQEILQGAIKQCELDTLVLGMAAVGSNPTTRHIDLQMNSKCSVVLAKTKPLETPLRISATPAVDPAPGRNP